MDEGRLGAWNSLEYANDGQDELMTYMYTICFQPASELEPETNTVKQFDAKGKEHTGQEYNVKGLVSDEEDGVTNIRWTMEFTGFLPDMTFEGIYDSSVNRITGRWFCTKTSDVDGTFLLSRLPCEVLGCRPGPNAFLANRYRSLWRFAIDATVQDIRRRTFSW